MFSTNFILVPREMARRIVTGPERDDEQVKRRRRMKALLNQSVQLLAEISRDINRIEARQDADIHDASKTSNSPRDPDADLQDASKTSNSSLDPDAGLQDSLTLTGSLQLPDTLQLPDELQLPDTPQLPDMQQLPNPAAPDTLASMLLDSTLPDTLPLEEYVESQLH